MINIEGVSFLPATWNCIFHVGGFFFFFFSLAQEPYRCMYQHIGLSRCDFAL
jgi:hypothetical protein